ncbi:MAG: GNAT family N-acetyltransferase [Melioribacteraceae bacterium]|nr:GNAT family N-acetyltransferase [Melioribacteraceae bacterium]
MNSNEIIYKIGLPEQFKKSAAKLYDEAFGKKFSVAVQSDTNRPLLLQSCFMLEYAIVAISENKLIGIAGFHTPSGSLTGGMTYSQLLAQLGFIKGNWAAIVFSLYERKPKPGELIMDGIAVKADSRGKGVGSRLLEEVANYAKEHEFNRIRLDVIDINPKAKKLYEHKGFKAVKTEYFPYLRWLLGFSGSTTMELNFEVEV